MDSYDLKRLIANKTSEKNAEIDGMWEELSQVREQLVTASRINALLVTEFGIRVSDEHWTMSIPIEKIEKLPWDSVAMRVKPTSHSLELEVRRKDDAEFSVDDPKVDIPKTGL